VELSSLVANIDGHQRKVVSSSVRPARPGLGTDGIVVRDGRTLPFVVARAWNAPAGHWPEAWYLVDPETREVLYEGPHRIASIWGLQSWTELSDQIDERLPLEPGSYLIVFALDGVQGGQLEIEARPESAEG
jgi:hypothetical protein